MCPLNGLYLINVTHSIGVVPLLLAIADILGQEAGLANMRVAEEADLHGDKIGVSEISSEIGDGDLAGGEALLNGILEGDRRRSAGGRGDDAAGNVVVLAGFAGGCTAGLDEGAVPEEAEVAADDDNAAADVRHFGAKLGHSAF